MKTRLLALVAAIVISNAKGQSPIEVTSEPVPMIPGGKTEFAILATPPQGFRIVKLVVYLEPISGFKPFNPNELILEKIKTTTNSVPLPQLNTPKMPPVEKGLLHNLSLWEPKWTFPEEKPTLLRISFPVGEKR